MTGQEVALAILRSAGITDVPVEMVSDRLTDHYDPRSHVLRLSESVCDSTSIAAIGVAAHEAGHAIQHQVGYAPLHLRNVMIPLTRIGSNLSMPLIIIGIINTFGGYLKDAITKTSCGIAGQVYDDGGGTGKGFCKDEDTGS